MTADAAIPPQDFTFRGVNREFYRSRDLEILNAAAAGTGKSICALVKVLTLLEKYHGCRGLFCRGTRSSLTQSGLVTWEQEVLGEDHPILTGNPVTRRVRQSYVFPNRSELVVAGLDDPGKTLSTQYDFIYVQECTEEGVTLAVYETLLRCLRNGKMVKNGRRWHQIMMDCNPTTPTHWLYKRQLSGKLKMFSSTHKDNPLYWSKKQNDYTDAGRDYIEGTLARMTGARRARFYLGQWQAAEGLVYDAYRPEIHNLPPGWEPPKGWKRVWAIDWGFTNPTALLMIAYDGDGRAYVYKEYYQTHRRAEEVARWAKAEVESGRESLPEVVVCDHDPECAASFRQYGPPGIGLKLADKTDKSGGIEATQERLDDAGDGRPRLFFLPGMLSHAPDQTLEDSGKPISLMGEIIGYIWDVRNPDRLKDEPLEKDDHAMDCLRYGIREIDKLTQKAPARTRPIKHKNPYSRLNPNTFK